MTLKDLAEQMPARYEARFTGGNDTGVTSVYYDSRLDSGEKGRIFACVGGEHTDGHDMAPDAVRSGASALLCGRELPLPVPQLIVKNVRAAMGEAEAILRGRPCEGLTMIAVTGTNGKTTTAYLTRSILRAGGEPAGMIGSIVYDDGAAESDSLHTTPEGPDIQEILSRMRGNGCRACVMETSSHGIEQGRIAGCAFDRVGFSNLTPEHLEYHKDMDSYFAAKRELFTGYTRGGWRAAVNADDDWGRLLLAEFPDKACPFTMKGGSSSQYRGSIAACGIEGMTIDAAAPDGESIRLRTPLVGEHNAYNILEAFVIADSLALPREAIKAGVSACGRVPGRLERYDFDNGVTAFVDFAHSSDGMEKVLTTLAGLVKGRLWVLWGAGGDRTALKRPVVGELMARFADRVVITTDNPRSESPAAIASAVEAGVLSCRARKCAGHEVILDRREAIYHALDNAERGDVVLIAGKGPERYIDFGNRREPFLDAGVAVEWARERNIEVL